jgi:uncharacterized membrane protein YeiB
MPLAPLTTADRLRGVDIARGVTLLGVLFVNTRTMFAPYAFSIDPSVALDGSQRTAANATLWACIETVCTLKFNSLFSMLFGFDSVAAARARDLRAAGRDGAAVRLCGHARRVGAAASRVPRHAARAHGPHGDDGVPLRIARLHGTGGMVGPRLVWYA